MTWLQAIILGLVQGVAEFLPISSSGHLAIFKHLLGLPDVEQENMFFDVLLHFATLVAIFVVYRKDIQEMIREFLEMVHLRRVPRGARPDGKSRRMILMIIAATLPLFLVLPVKDFLEGLGSSLMSVAGALILTGAILFYTDRMSHGDKGIKGMTLSDALLIGVGQAFAVIPGLSRSGTTISVGMARGLDRNFAVKFSFLMSIPAVLGATLLELFDAIGGVASGVEVISFGILMKYLLGMVVAGFTGYFSIRFIRHLASKDSFGGFAYYCWGAGVIALILSLIG